jgi:hypothetical protein
MTDPQDLPPLDVKDDAGRLRRLALAFVIGSVAASIAYVICDGMAKPDEMAGGFDGGHQARAYRFVYYMTGFAFAAFFSVALLVQNHIAKKRWRERLVMPRARAKIN